MFFGLATNALNVRNNNNNIPYRPINNVTMSLYFLLFLTFSVLLVTDPKKKLYSMANPARGLLTREKRTHKKRPSAPPPPPMLLVKRSKNKKLHDASTCLGATQVSVHLAPVQDPLCSSTTLMVFASHNSTLPCAITVFPVSLLLSFPGDV